MANNQPGAGNPGDELADFGPVEPGEGPGGSYVAVPGIILLAAYLVIATALCLYGLSVMWPVPTPSGQPTATQSASPPPSPTPTPAVAPSPTPGREEVKNEMQSTEQKPGASPSPVPGHVTAFGHRIELWDEVRLLWIMILGGALGSLVHALRSVYWYVGNRNLKRSWLAKYALLPFGGSTLAVVFYFVVRGGFFSPQAGFPQTSPFGFAALAALVGLFSEQAVLKLKQVAETILSKPGQGADAKPQKDLNKPAESQGAEK